MADFDPTSEFLVLGHESGSIVVLQRDSRNNSFKHYADSSTSNASAHLSICWAKRDLILLGLENGEVEPFTF